MPTPDIADLSAISAQRSFIESRPEPPSATSTLLMRRFATSENDGAVDHVIVGVHVVLGKGQPNGLWEALHVDRATQRIDAGNPVVAARSVSICCDTLEVRGEFSVPEASVNVFARRLIWADAAASINTSPLAWTAAKAQNAAAGQAGRDGADGRHAGSLQVFVREMVPDAGPRPRLVASGGPGQDPGKGLDGAGNDWMASYTSYPFAIKDSGISTSRRTVSFSPPAIYVEYEWRWAGIRSWGPGHLGENRFPKEGSAALAPGAPGNGGNAGALTTNLTALLRSFEHEPGAAGARERDCVGGAAGRPTSSAKYKVTLAQDLFGTDAASFTLTKTDQQATKPGRDAPARPASRGDGSNPDPVVLDVANAWLHPLGLQATLEYARDLFLAGDRDAVLSLLQDYDEALAQGMPATGGWPDTPASQWTAAQAEVAAMRQRLLAQLDYFGHPAGYTPLLSLPGAIKLYADETSRALRMMILTQWIAGTERELSAQAKGATDAIAGVNQDSRQAAEQTAAGEARLAQAQGLIGTLENELTTLGNRLVELRNALLVKVVNDKEREAAIKFGIKMAGALCQVIPVGQPALGTIGSLGAVAADFVGGDPDQAPDTISKMGDLLTKANETAGKARAAAAAAGKNKTAEPPKDSGAGRSASSAWATVGRGLGPAVSGVADAVRALQVPQHEIDAELARLEAEDPDWNAMTRDIRSLNERKVELFSDLVDALQSVGEGFARLAANAGAVVGLQLQREQALGRVDPAAVYAARQLGQRSRLTLQKYLYLMVKAYESTLLMPLEVDWSLAAVTAKIDTLLSPDGGFSFDTLNAECTALDVLFQDNLAAIRNKLLEEFDVREQTTTLKLGLSSQQTPEALAALNDTGRVELDPQAFGLILPNEQLARLSGMALTRLTFDPDGPALPETVNAIISVVPATTGTIRRAAGLYLLSSDAPVRWGWTCLGPDDFRPSTPSATASDVLDFILGTGAGAIRQKVSLPPAWSNLRVAIEFSPPIAKDRRPRISELYFEADVDSSPASDSQRLLSVRSLGTPGGAVIGCTPDLAKRGAGIGDMIRIYGAGQTVTLSAPDHAGDAAFEGWEVNGVGPKATPPPRTVRVKVDDFVFAASRWSRSSERVGPTVVLSNVIDAATVRQIAQEHPDPAVRRALSGPRRAPVPVRVGRRIRVGPSATAAVAGVVSADGAPDDLGERQGEWRLVNYLGIVGWIDA